MNLNSFPGKRQNRLVCMSPHVFASWVLGGKSGHPRSLWAPLLASLQIHTEKYRQSQTFQLGHGEKLTHIQF
jgi:hypothetical protein